MGHRSIVKRAALIVALVVSFGAQTFAPTSAGGDGGRGTTLRRTIRSAGEGAELEYGPGISRKTRRLEWQGAGGTGRPLVGFKQLSDVHVVDEESPGRVEWLDGCETPFSAAYRVHEAMSTQIGESMLRQLAKITSGPATGVPLDFVVSTGDNVDNNQENETEWFIKLLNGGRVDPNSGGDGYHGYDRDQFSEALSRRILRIAQRPFDATGTKVPWYAVLGNHDGLAQGNAPANDGFESVATGDAKVFADVEAEQDCPDDPNDFEGMQDALQDALLGSDVQNVPADEKRRFLSHNQLIKEYADSGGRPEGHGLADAPQDSQHGRAGYYGFRVNDEMRGISLDTTSYDGVANGHIPHPQWKWLVKELRRYSKYTWVKGKRKPTGADRNKLIVLFSHHSSATLQNPGTDEAGAPYHCFRRSDTPECQDARGLKHLLHAFPNVILWVNGHEHNNAVRSFPNPGDKRPERGFWEINTASHIDWPQQSRLIEVAWAPGDGAKADSIYIYGTTVDHGAPLEPNEESQGMIDFLASVGRVESYRDACIRQGQANCEAAGDAGDQNVKLVMKAPYNLGD